MKNTGILRIQAFGARQSSPIEGVLVTVSGNGFTAQRITDETGTAADLSIEAPSCALSLQEDNTIRPYAVVDLTAAKAGFRTVRIQGVQIFAGQVTLAQPEMIPETEEDRDVVNPPIVIPEHSLFTGDGGSGPDPIENCMPRVLSRVIIPKNITVHLGRPAASARNVTVSFRDYIANVASSEVYPTWPDENNPTGHPELFRSKIPFDRDFLPTHPCILRPDHYTVHQQHNKFAGQMRNLCQFSDTLHLRLHHAGLFLLLFQFRLQCIDPCLCLFHFFQKRLVHFRKLDGVNQTGHLIQIQLLHSPAAPFYLAFQPFQLTALRLLPHRVIPPGQLHLFRVAEVQLVKDGGAGDGERAGVCCVADLHVLRLDGDGFALRDGVGLVLVLARAGVDHHAAHFFIFAGCTCLDFLRRKILWRLGVSPCGFVCLRVVRRL